MTEYRLEDYVSAALNLSTSDISKSLYKSKLVLSIAQFNRLMSIFDDEEGKNRKHIEEVMSNLSEGSKELGWSHPTNMRRLELCLEDSIWNVAGRYIDYVSPSRSIGWSANDYVEEAYD
jgi:hypothetical protein